MNELDKNITYLLNKLATKNNIIFYFFRIFTFTGEWWMYILYGIIVISIDFNKGIDAAKLGLLAYGVNYPAYYFIKNIIKRKRPFEKYEQIKALVKPPDKYSLPSGHAGGTMISALITTSFFEGLEFLFLWPIIVGLSRVFLGVHYISDCLIGLLLGFICYNLAYLIMF
mgnify:FL=1|jgi:undecaprenyl-diphosphatase